MYLEREINNIVERVIRELEEEPQNIRKKYKSLTALF